MLLTLDLSFNENSWEKKENRLTNLLTDVQGNGEEENRQTQFP